MNIDNMMVTCEVCRTKFEVRYEVGRPPSVGPYLHDETVDCPKPGCGGRLRLGDLPGKIVSVCPMHIEDK